MEIPSWILLAIIFLIYWGIVKWLDSKGKLEKYGITAYGPILMIRTTKGLELLERISKARKLLRLLANIGIPAVFAGMVFMFFLLVLMDFILLTTPPQPSKVTHPRNVLLIPGINEYIPLVWGWIGLIVTLVVHEFSHAILCRVEGVRVKAMGLLLALIPIGGFAEPDEEELMGKEAKTTRLQRVRIFSAGVISNFIVAVIAFSIFFYLLGFLTPLVTVEKVVEGSPAYGIVEEKSAILSINGKPVHSIEDVSKALIGYDSIVLKLRTEEGIKEVTLPKEAGVRIVGLYEDYPAAKAGLKEGMIIFRINNIETPTLTDFRNVLGKTKPGDTVTIHAYYNGTVKEFHVTLTDSPFGDSGFLGILVEEYISGITPGYSEVILNMLKSIPSWLTSPQGWLSIMILPFFKFSGFGADALNYFEITGFWSSAGNTIFYLLNIFYWVGWLNFYVGLFNCLPAIPLDGGRVFHETLSALLSRRFGEKGEEISYKVVKLLAFIVFSSIILSIVMPNIQGLLR